MLVPRNCLSFPTPVSPVKFCPPLCVSAPLDISYQWTYIICGLLYLAPFTQHDVVKAHPCCSMSGLYSMLRLSHSSVHINHTGLGELLHHEALPAAGPRSLLDGCGMDGNAYTSLGLRKLKDCLLEDFLLTRWVHHHTLPRPITCSEGQSGRPQHPEAGLWSGRA